MALGRVCSRSQSTADDPTPLFGDEPLPADDAGPNLLDDPAADPPKKRREKKKEDAADWWKRGEEPPY